MSRLVTTDQQSDAAGAQFSTGGMLVKLILLPASVVVAIVLAIVWFSRPSDDVDALIDALAQEGNPRWQAALSLSAALQEPSSGAIKHDPAVAWRLVDVLQKELKAGGMDRDRVRLRVYLCRALGEFRIADPLPVLLEAARLERSEREVAVRGAALEAVAVLVSNVGPGGLRGDPRLMAVLLESAAEENRQLRQRAAFALGVVGGQRAQARLELMLTDPCAEVRYNAATGLARHGNAQCVEVLREMLDPQQADLDRATVQKNALQATAKLAMANPTADLGRLREAVERLRRADVAPEVKLKAVELLHRWGRWQGTSVAVGS